MSTTNDERLDDIRYRLKGYSTNYWERTYSHEACIFAMDIRALLKDGADLLAEVDRLRENARLDREMRKAAHKTELAALRAAHTWTRATPSTMPPASQGNVDDGWLVEMPHPNADEWGCPLTTINRYWVLEKRDGNRVWFREGELFPIENTRFAAMPMERDAPAQDGGGDAEVTS